MQSTRNAFNRFIMLIISVVSFGFGIVVLLLLAGWITPRQVTPDGATMFAQWNYFAQMRSHNPMLDVLVGVIAALAGLLIFLLEIWPARRRQVQATPAWQSPMNFPDR